MSDPQPRRRTRISEATRRDIHQSARRLLVTQGGAAVTVNAVARDMGMRGPSLYHYYASRQALVDSMTAEFFDEAAQAVETAGRARPGATTGERFRSACRALRDWALQHPAEFEWVFARPVNEPQQDPASARQRAGTRFARVFLDLITEAWELAPFPAPDPATMTDALRAELDGYARLIGGPLPPEAVYVYVTCWIRLYGHLCMEVLNQMNFVLTDMEPFFEQCLDELLATLSMGP
ncbi:TetR/AcrR family transcriptional regulator [Streptomyces sp. NPDC048305]|uniref:TetR/AcrR family transcriptional regulator n=1 Tax=Streptomyces sp. NPDC048305 TaxID=3365532 RepID=UPI0037228C87